MRIRTLGAAASIALLASALTGCAAIDPGEPTTQQREIADVTAIDLQTSGDVVVTRGDDVSLMVTAGANVIDSITADVRDGVLTLDLQRAFISFPTFPGPITFELTVPMIDSVEVSGSGDVTADFAGADAVDLTISGSGDIEATGLDASTVDATIEGSGNILAEGIDVDTLTARVDGSGDITLSGAVATQTLEIDGAGDIDAADVESVDAVATIDGAGDIAVHATGTLSAAIDGSGTIRYSGSADVEKSVSGAGDIVRVD
ncbi:head GIN domain-containing protein [Paramicrobacterium agarici]|uniref:head GIN domain-containing protein n=1 Tax=Paramicrobacterium agarici TaxID=630514 RepID=UPI00114D5900|nr:head GIN domain-containing protein [Microbacterium agarici]TQO22861.1 putative autotransporter adhesin-like protein [Microbacterium agarici]